MVHAEAIGSIRQGISLYPFELGSAMSVNNTQLFLIAREVRGDAGLPACLRAMAAEHDRLPRLKCH